MSESQFDPWTQVRTRHDLPADEVISALQKEVRRGHAENAAMIAYEMVSTSPELERKLWDRLAVISVEDIGFGQVNAPVLVHALEKLSHHFDYGAGDRALFAIHAVRYLAMQRKDRSSDEMLNWIKSAIENQGVRPEIPDYALDMHTARGQALGRGFKHFMEQGALVEPEWSERDTTYHQRLMQMLKE
ncbi:MAG: AAA family ATPase [Anaerolineae bacterium]|nr:AAA family ATPase [Anaerolineae bacterium]